MSLCATNWLLVYIDWCWRCYKKSSPCCII